MSEGLDIRRERRRGYRDLHHIWEGQAHICEFQMPLFDVESHAISVDGSLSLFKNTVKLVYLLKIS
jgi:hypothetical protein